MKASPLESILFDPLAWVHKERVIIPDKFYQGRCRSVINEIFREQYQLPLPAEIKIDYGLTSLFIKSWSLLPHVAFILCCQRYRAQLANRGLYTLLPQAVRQFALLNLLPPCGEQAENICGLNDISQLIYSEIVAFETEIAAPLRPCLPLLFPPEYVSVTKQADLPMANFLTLRLAIQHVQRNISVFC